VAHLVHLSSFQNYYSPLNFNINSNLKVAHETIPTPLVRGTRNNSTLTLLIALVRGTRNNSTLISKNICIFYRMKTIRKSYTETNKIYFFTATIHEWLPLLDSQKNKELIISYLKELSEKGLIKVYAFIIMPNHLHFIWEQTLMNGKKQLKEVF
jgi:hypothetical protein